MRRVVGRAGIRRAVWVLVVVLAGGWGLVKPQSSTKAVPVAKSTDGDTSQSTEPILGKLVLMTEHQIQVKSKDFPSLVVFEIDSPKALSEVKAGEIVVVVFRWEKDQRVLVSIQASGAGEGSEKEQTPKQEYGKTAENEPAPAPAHVAPQASPQTPIESPYNAPAQQGSEQADVQVGDPGTLIQEKLSSEIKLTKATADHTDIVAAGDVVELHKDGLMMCSSASSYAYSNVYQNGVVMPTMKNRAADALKGWGLGKLAGGKGIADATSNGCASRKFVAGEKLWVTGITLQKDGILMNVFSDPYNDTRYYGEVKIPFQKGAPIPSTDVFAKTVRDLITVAPKDDRGSSQAAYGGGQQQAAAYAPAAPLQVIAPPPPPADQPPPTIAVGQTKDQVVAAFGQPVRTAKLAGTREIYFYKDMKVTFTNGRVSNVE